MAGWALLLPLLSGATWGRAPPGLGPQCGHLSNHGWPVSRQQALPPPFPLPGPATVAVFCPQRNQTFLKMVSLTSRSSPGHFLSRLPTSFQTSGGLPGCWKRPPSLRCPQRELGDLGLPGAWNSRKLSQPGTAPDPTTGLQTPLCVFHESRCVYDPLSFPSRGDTLCYFHTTAVSSDSIMAIMIIITS